MAVAASDPGFLVLHALRIKGFATADVLADVSGVGAEAAAAALTVLAARDLAVFRPSRALWQLSATGRAQHLEAVHAELAGSGARDDLLRAYGPFLVLNGRFKELCGRWQLRDGAMNDHADAAYDAGVVADLTGLDAEAQSACRAFAAALARYGGYGPRLAAARSALAAGDHRMFTGVMCASYHDIWMELHEDLILTLGIDRTAEGSF